MNKKFLWLFGALLLLGSLLFIGLDLKVIEGQPIPPDTENGLVDNADKPPSTENDLVDNADQPSALLISIILLSITCLISVAISFYLYRWRKILISQPNSLVPEEWGKYLRNVGDGLGGLASATDKNLKNLISSNTDLSARISNMTNTYMDLQAVLDEKDKEIKRLKNGYDAEIFRKYIARFARVEQTLSDLLNDSPQDSNLIMLERLFEDAFAECGVEKYQPELGSDYRTARGVSDRPKEKITSDPALEFKISEIIEAGYELMSGIESITIIPSKVRIYKLDKEVS